MKNIKDNRIPYTYLIGWKDLNKWYYGVRYGKGCCPSDLFIKYFTSSKHVKKFISINGMPDVIQIRKTFTSIHKARNWEIKVLKRLNVKEKEYFLNKTDHLTPCIVTLMGADNPRYGYKYTEEERKQK